MAELQADFELVPRSNIDAEIELPTRSDIEATFELNVNADGRDAKINGVNTLTLTATDGIELTQVGDVATLTANGLQEEIATKQDIIDDLSTIRSNAEAGKQASDTIATYGDIVTHDVDEFATASQGDLADTALQPGDNVSELVNNAGYINKDVNNLTNYTKSSELAEVATSGKYQDLTGLPTIGSGVLTIQKNSTTIDTFSANATSNKTINITVPTTAADVGALPDTTTINDLTTEAQQDALNSGIDSTLVGQIGTNQSDISDIQGLIPSQATTSNQLADKDFVNSSIATNTANFIGTFNSVAELEAYSGTLTNNDYAFVITTDALGNTAYDRYKYTTVTTPPSWQFEYELNNSSFTANQWAAINSGATTTNIGQIATNTGDISDINTTIGGYGDIVTHDADEFATAAQGSLADTALQPGDNVSELANDSGYITGITSSDVTTALGYTPYDSSNPSGYISGISSSDVTTALGYTPYDSANPSGYISGITSLMVTTALGYTPVNPSSLATVATTGDYDDLLNKPTIPAAQVNSDWDAVSGVAQILNKPTLATVATSGSYNDLTDKPTIPTSSDYWTVGTSGVNDTQTTYSRKILKYIATYSTPGDDQQNGFRVLGDESASTGDFVGTGYWMGRMMVGTNKRTFLMGVTKNLSTNAYMCGLGAHSWTDAETQTGAAWEDIYIQPDGNKAVYFGGRQWRVNSGWMKVQNDGNTTAAYRTFINTGTNTSPTWRTVLPNQASGTGSILLKPSVNATFSYSYATSLNGTITANYGTSVGYGSSAGNYATAVGCNAVASGKYSIQLGNGTNSTANTMNVALSNTLNVQLLDASGEIPDACIKTTIARVSQIPTDNASLTNGAGYITSSDIPVTDVEVNGTSVLNGTVAEVTVPTQASDINALPDSTKYGADLDYTSNTLTLLDQDGNALGNSVTITTTSSLNDLSDVTITSATSGQALLYDGSKWVNGSAGVSATYDAVNERITFA